MDKTKQAEAVLQPLVQELLTWARAGADMAQTEAPEMAREAVTWAVVSNVLYFPVALAAAGFFGWWTKKISACDDEAPFCILTGGVSLFFAVSACFAVAEACKAYFVPRLYLIEYFSRLVSS
jgi:hypothetical protein